MTSRFPAAFLAAFVALASATPARATDDFLDPGKAFALSARVLDARHVALDYAIQPGYHLYRERFAFAAQGATLQAPSMPAGDRHFDAALGHEVETFDKPMTVVIGIASAQGSFVLKATNQGCADAGLCYPPQERAIAVTLKDFGARADTAASIDEAIADKPAPADVAPRDDDGRLAAALRGGRLGLVVPLFLLAGLLLSLTPCVLPMVPILSSIIVGHGSAVTRWRGFTLACAYALGMAVLYTALGVTAGLLGEGLAAWLQKPWVLASFAGLLVLLSMSMFGLYELQLPAPLRDRLSSRGDRMQGGQYAGVFAMGGLSALVVSPCVAAPLATALLFISQTGSAVLGGVALFALAIGMSVPLLLVGASAGSLLPRAGAWMEQVKQVFGLMLLAVAIYMVQPVLPALAAMGCWGALLVVGGVSLGAFEPVPAGAHVGVARSVKGIGLVLVMLGALQFVGIASGGRDVAQPLAHLARAGAGDGMTSVAAAGLHFETVGSAADLDRRLQSAGRPVMLDFYADWCVSCKEMEATTFVDPAVRATLGHALLLRADVTANSDDDRALLRRFHLFGPPGIVLFDAAGREIEAARVVGFEEAGTFRAQLAHAGL